MNASTRAVQLGATLSGGINWTWANGFATIETAESFVEWLDANGYEHRGVYPGSPNSEDPDIRLIGVRFR